MVAGSWLQRWSRVSAASARLRMRESCNPCANHSASARGNLARNNLAARHTHYEQVLPPTAHTWSISVDTRAKRFARCRSARSNRSDEPDRHLAPSIQPTRKRTGMRRSDLLIGSAPPPYDRHSSTVPGALREAQRPKAGKVAKRLCVLRPVKPNRFAAAISSKPPVLSSEPAAASEDFEARPGEPDDR